MLNKLVFFVVAMVGLCFAQVSEVVSEPMQSVSSTETSPLAVAASPDSNADTLAPRERPEEPMATCLTIGNAVDDIIFDLGSAGEIGVGTTNPYGTIHIARDHWQAINLGGTADPAGDQGNRGITWGYRSDGNPYYMIRTNYKTYGSYTYSRLQIGWHTGLEIGAASSYGGTRFYNNSPFTGTQIMSIGDGDNHVRVNNYLFAQYLNSTDNSVSSGVTGIMVKQGDNYYRTATAGAIGSFLGNYGNWIPNNGSGDWQIASSSDATDYPYASLELRERGFGGSSAYAAPRLSFHWGGVVASQIAIESSGRIAIRNNPGTAYENLIANHVYANGNAYIGSYGGINSVPTTYGSIGLIQTKNSYYGVLLGQSTTNPNLMYDTGSNGGIYFESGGWLYYSTKSNLYTGFGTTGPSYKLHVVGDVYANGGWLRTSGSAGWYNESYGGGWYMIDGSYIRNYNNKTVYITDGTNYSYSAYSGYGDYGYGSSYGLYYQGGTYAGVYGNCYSATSGSQGVYGYHSNSTYMSYYGLGYSMNGVQGYTFWGYDYHNGVAGYRYDDGRYRTSGVFGGISQSTTPARWGALGYQNSSAAEYAVYGNAGYATGGGRRRPGEVSDDIRADFAFGGYSDFMAGWFRGELYGLHLKGERYAQYNDGNTYSNGIQGFLQDNGGSSREIVYTNVSTDVSINSSGTGRMRSGTARVEFDRVFINFASDEVPIVVTATPMGKSKGIYIIEIDKTGFTVIENDDGSSDIEFSWIAMARRKGYESRPEPPAEILANDFDEGWEKVMFNENDLEHSAGSVHWNGRVLSFTPRPENEQEIYARQVKEKWLNDPLSLTKDEWRMTGMTREQYLKDKETEQQRDNDKKHALSGKPPAYVPTPEEVKANSVVPVPEVEVSEPENSNNKK